MDSVLPLPFHHLGGGPPGVEGEGEGATGDGELKACPWLTSAWVSSRHFFLRSDIAAIASEESTTKLGFLVDHFHFHLKNENGLASSVGIISNMQGPPTGGAS